MTLPCALNVHYHMGTPQSIPVSARDMHYWWALIKVKLQSRVSNLVWTNRRVLCGPLEVSNRSPFISGHRPFTLYSLSICRIVSGYTLKVGLKGRCTFYCQHSGFCTHPIRVLKQSKGTSVRYRSQFKLWWEHCWFAPTSANKTPIELAMEQFSVFLWHK